MALPPKNSAVVWGNTTRTMVRPGAAFGMKTQAIQNRLEAAETALITSH